MGAIAVGLVLGDDPWRVAAVAAGVFTLGVLIRLGHLRTPEARTRARRASWLCLFFTSEVLLMGILWVAITALFEGTEDLNLLVGLPAGLCAAAVYTWDLWKRAAGGQPAVRLPRFGIAGDPRGETQGDDGDRTHNG